MHFYRGTLTLDGGKEINLKQIGKGMFSKAYLTIKGKPYVYVITQQNDAGDYSKEILSTLRSPYLPSVTDVGCLDDGSCVYKMPYYRAPLRKKNSTKAWKQYTVLKQCWEEAQANIRAKLAKRYDYRNAAHQFIYHGYDVMAEVVDCARGNKDVPAGLVKALESLREGAANYGSDYSFEFSPRNLATTESGHLILLDVVFSMESVGKIRARARKKARW